jgi:HEAT repeat protein
MTEKSEELHNLEILKKMEEDESMELKGTKDLSKALTQYDLMLRYQKENGKNLKGIFEAIESEPVKYDTDSENEISLKLKIIRNIEELNRNIEELREKREDLITQRFYYNIIEFPIDDKLIRFLSDVAREVRFEACKALERRNWKPKTVLERVHYIIAKEQKKEIRKELFETILPNWEKAYKDNEFAYWVIYLVALLKDMGVEIVDPLIKILEDEGNEPFSRDVAYLTLSFIGDSRAIDPLINVFLKSEKEITYSFPGLFLIAERALGSLFLLLKHADLSATNVDRLTDVLSFCGKRAMNDFVTLLNHENPYIRLNAVIALFSIGDPEGIAEIYRLKDDKDEDLQSCVKSFVSVMGSPKFNGNEWEALSCRSNINQMVSEDVYIHLLNRNVYCERTIATDYHASFAAQALGNLGTSERSAKYLMDTVSNVMEGDVCYYALLALSKMIDNPEVNQFFPYVLELRGPQLEKFLTGLLLLKSGDQSFFE